MKKMMLVFAIVFTVFGCTKEEVKKEFDTYQRVMAYSKKDNKISNIRPELRSRYAKVQKDSVFISTSLTQFERNVYNRCKLNIKSPLLYYSGTSVVTTNTGHLNLVFIQGDSLYATEESIVDRRTDYEVFIPIK